MKAVIQRVARAEVRVEGEVVGRITHGLVVLLGVFKTDTPCLALTSVHFKASLFALRVAA